MENEILPDFIYSHTIGEISNRSSLIKHFDNLTYVSINNVINTFSTRKTQCLATLTDHKPGRITALEIFSFQDMHLKCIGTETGTIKLFESTEKLKQFRPHSKRVTSICTYDTYIISASADGTLIQYDIFNEEIKVYYKGTKNAIYNIKIDNMLLAANCADNVIRYWNLGEEECLGIVPFENEILDFVVFNNHVVVFFCNGELVVADMESKVKKTFQTYKKIRAVKKYKEFLYVLCSGKFMVYKMVMKSELILQDIGSYKVDKYFHDFDVKDISEIDFVGYKNKIVSMNLKDGREYKIVYHENELFNVLVSNKKIVTCSEEKYIVWKVVNDQIEKLHTCEFEYKAIQACIFGSIVLIGSTDSIYFYDIKNNSLVKRVDIALSVMHLNKNTLFVGMGTELSIYQIESKETNTNNRDLNIDTTIKRNKGNSSQNIDTCDLFTKLISQKRYSEEISFINSSDSQLYYGIAFLDNTLKIYDYYSHENKNMLYGHSLPIRYFSFSPNSGTILTCGSDKLIKLWGTEFGECRKSFIGDAQNVSYITNKGFIFCDDTMQYYKKHDCIKKYKGYDHTIVCYSGNMLVVGMKYGLKYYKTGLYEIDNKNDSEEIEEEILRELKITDFHLYEKLVLELNKIENAEKEGYSDLYNILKYINLAEIDKFIYFMAESHVKIILMCLKEFYHMFPVTAIRIFINIGRVYGYLCKNNISVYELYEELRSLMREMKELIGTDMMEMVLL